MTNIHCASAVLQNLYELGVREVVLCSGARNAPFVVLLAEKNPFVVHPFFEERSAGFFALGKIQAGGAPVAVFTTSGTAAAELLPATIEANYQGLPLILITADRPRRYRGSGAPQTIEQPGLYSHYVERAWDLELEELPKLDWSGQRPIHINVCFDEPLIDEKISKWRPVVPQVRGVAPRKCDSAHLQCRRPLVILGGLPFCQREAMRHILREWQRPVYAEGPSHLRGQLGALEVRGGEKSLAQISYDGIVRIGSVPTLRLWRDLEKSSLPVYNFSHLPFAGLPGRNQVFALSQLAQVKANFEDWSNAERERDRQFETQHERLFQQLPLSEPSWVRWLSRQMNPRSRVFIGNSLPIREWDLAADRDVQVQVFANRGANGIDGLISTFMGVATAEQSNWGVIGDISALYDLSGLWPARNRAISDLNLVIINNGGGKIFERLFHNPLFENGHGLNFKAWAQMWGWDYLHLQQPQALAPTHAPRVIELVPSPAETESFWQNWEKKL